MKKAQTKNICGYMSKIFKWIKLFKLYQDTLNTIVQTTNKEKHSKPDTEKTDIRYRETK